MSDSYTHIPVPTTHADLYADAVRHVARYCMVAPEAIRARDRTPSVTRARFLVFRVLADGGLNPAEIARALALNHSTILHGLARVEGSPALLADYAGLKPSLPAALRPPGERSLPEAIRVACTDQHPTLTDLDAANVTAYVTGDVLGRRAVPWEALARYHGRRLLRERPLLDAEVGRILALFETMAPVRLPVRLPPARVSYPLRGLEVSR